MIRVSEQLDGNRVEFVVDAPTASSSTATRLWYEWGGAATPTATTHLAAGLVALVPTALRSGLDLVVDGEVDRALVESVQEWADAWAFLRPDLFRPVNVHAEEHRAAAVPPTRRSGILAFSGGVDSLYAASEHLYRTVDPDPALVLVHGFDLPLDETEGFGVALRSAQTAADALGYPLSWVRTNWRRDFSRHWTMEFGAGLASVLQLWRADAARAVLGSDEGSGYGFEVFPWGSNPATNHLLGSAQFPVVTHGFASDRVAKCRMVAERPELLDVVRVCLVDDAGGRNCGVCEKCLRTKLCFAAAGVRDVPAFDDQSLEALNDLELHKPHVLDYFDAALEHEPSQLRAGERALVQSFMARERRRLHPSVPRRVVRSARYRAAKVRKQVRRLSASDGLEAGTL